MRRDGDAAERKQMVTQEADVALLPTTDAGWSRATLT